MVAASTKRNGMAGFNSPVEFFDAVAMAYTRRRLDSRLAPLQAAGSDEQSTQDDPYGGFFVPEAMAPGMLTTFPDDPMAGRVTTFPMGSPLVYQLARTDQNHNTAPSGGLVAGRRLETSEATSSLMQMEKIRFDATSLFGLSYATEQLVSDSPQSIAALLEAGFRDEFTDHMIHERLFGTGAGQFTGVVNAGCTITVSKEGGQSADTIVADNVIKMRKRCWRIGRAIWLANPDCYDQLVGLQVESTTPAGSKSLYEHSTDEDKPDTLSGRPIFYTEYCKTLGDKGDLVLGDWSQYLEGTYSRGRNESIHVRFENHTRTFKFWVSNDGAPWWRVPVTPKNGSDTLSPFVVLEERA